MSQPYPQQPPGPMAPSPYGQGPRPRPGGLTALAVLNFVFGGIGCLVLFGLFALLSVAETGVRAMTGGQKSLTEAPGAGVVYLMLLLGLAGVALLIVSGVGYLSQKKVLGRGVGTAYGCLGIFNNLLSLALIPSGFGFFTIIGLVYPVLTLVLVNTTFKNDFIY